MLSLKCPKCGSYDILREEDTTKLEVLAQLPIVGSIFALISFFKKKRYGCVSCGHDWLR